MGIHIRDLYVGNTGWATYLFWSRTLVVLREMFLAGRWTDGTFTNKTEYDNNIALTLSDCEVSSSVTGQITSTTGGFSGLSSNYLITLLAANDNNRGVYRIFKVINDNTIIVRSPPPDGWTTETGISARFCQCGETDPIANSNVFTMVPPSGLMEPRFYTTNGYNFIVNAYPDSYSGGHAVSGDSGVLTVSYLRNAAYLNAYFSGTDPTVIFYFSEVASTIRYFCVGELEGVETGDNYPGYLFFDAWTSVTNDYDHYNDINVNMINHALAPISFKFMGMSRQISENASGNYRQLDMNNRLINKKAKLEKPWVFEPSANGGYPRGKVGAIRLTNRHWEKLRAMGGDGLWRHMNGGMCFPMNGLNDKQPYIY